MWNPKPYYLLLHSSIDKSLISITFKGCFFVLDSTWLTDMFPFHLTHVLKNYPPSPYPIPISIIGVLNPSFPFGTHLAIGDKDTKASFLIFNKLNIHIATPWLTTTHHTTKTEIAPLNCIHQEDTESVMKHQIHFEFWPRLCWLGMIHDGGSSLQIWANSENFLSFWNILA